MKLLIPTIIGVLLALQVQSTMPPLFTASQVTTVAHITIEKKLTPTEIIAKTKHPEEIMVIWALESSMGRNDSCKNIGKVNGFGFAQSTHTWNCFDSFEEVVSKVDEWLTMRDRENYCLYQQGIRTPDCAYALKAIKLLEP